MSRKVAWAGLGAVVVAAYAGASWLCGRAVNNQFEAWQESSKSQLPPFITVEREATPGLFRSTQLLKIRMDADELRNIWPQGASLRVAADEPFELVLRNEVAHGPLPGFTGAGIARIRSHFVLSEQTRQVLNEVIGDEEPISAVTLLGLFGGGVTDITSPAFEVTEGDTRLAWQGVRSRFAFGPGISTLGCEGKAPGLRVHNPKGEFVLGELALDCDLTRILDELYAGTMRFQVAGMDGTFDQAGRATPFKMQALSYAGDITHADGYVDLALKMDLDRLQSDALVLNDVDYHFTLKHLHASTYAALIKEFRRHQFAKASDPAAAAELMNTWREFGPALLEHDPELVIDRIAFTMPEGSASVSGRVRLDGFTREDMQGMAALNKLEVVADLSIAEALLHKDWSGAAKPRDMDTGASPPSRANALRTQAAQLEQQGFLVRRDGQYVSHIEFKAGRLTVNGRPLR